MLHGAHEELSLDCMLLSSKSQVPAQLGSHSLLFEKSFQQEKAFVLGLSKSLLKQVEGGDRPLPGWHN